MRVLMYLVSYLCSTAGLIIAFCYVLRSGKIIKGMLIGYGLSIVCVFLVSVVFPGILAGYDKEYSLCFPEAIAVPAIIFTGWLSSSIVVVIAGLIRYFVARFWSHSK